MSSTKILSLLLLLAGYIALDVIQLAQGDASMGLVNCGCHDASSCALCGTKPDLCNGDCTWKGSKCVLKNMNAGRNASCYFSPNCNDAGQYCYTGNQCCWGNYCCLDELTCPPEIHAISAAAAFCYPSVKVWNYLNTSSLDTKISGEVQMGIFCEDAYYTNLAPGLKYTHDRGCGCLLTGVTAHYIDSAGNQLNCEPYSSSGTSYSMYHVIHAPGQPAAGCKVVRADH